MRTKKEAEYGPGMKAEHCGICQHFRPPHRCAIVEGTIERDKWCKYFRHDKRPSVMAA